MRIRQNKRKADSILVLLLFTVFAVCILAVLLTGEVSPSVISQYPDELESGTVDRIGLALTRFSAEVTRPFSSISPLESLSRGECVERDEVIRVLLVDFAAIPVLFCLLAAFLMPRKADGND